MVKLRSTPEDFRVEEQGGPTPRTGDDWEDYEHRLYRLEKRGHDSLSLLARLSREFNLPRRSFGISGLKDRHAVTSQMVSLPTGKGRGLPTEINQSVGDSTAGLKDSGWRLTLLGGTASKLRSGSHSANRFSITVRDITREQIDGLPRRLEQSRVHGWPNWFDTQRFGSAVGHRLPGADIVAAKYESAMKLALTQRNKSDRSDKRRDKKKMAEVWPKIGSLKLETRAHQKLIKAYNRAIQDGAEGAGSADANEAKNSEDGADASNGQNAKGTNSGKNSKSGGKAKNNSDAKNSQDAKNTKNTKIAKIAKIAKTGQKSKNNEELWRRVYMAMPYDIRGMWISAWQSSEWNALLTELLEENFPDHLMRLVKIGVGGPLFFPEAPTGKRGAPKRQLISDILETLKELPETLQFPHSELDLSAIDQYLSDHHREVLIHSEIEASEPEIDEMKKGKGKRWKTTIEFDLPSGAYATVLIKRLFH